MGQKITPDQLPTPQVVRLRRGGVVVYKGRLATVIGIASTSEVLLKVNGTREAVVASLSDLSDHASEERIATNRREHTFVPDDQALERAQVWLEQFRGLDWAHPLSEERKRAIAETMGVSSRTVTRHFFRFLESPTAAAQLSSRPGPERGSRRLPGAAEVLICKAIEEVYEKQERGSIRATQREVALKFRAFNIDSPPPSYSAVRNRIMCRDRWKAARKRVGRVRADASQGPAGPAAEPCRALDFVQMDHAIVDLIVVDPETREEIGRPWITLAIDVATRCVLGFHLTFDPPSQTSVALALVHACLPKNDWLKEIGCKGEWKPFGLMKCIGWDNAKCFKATSLATTCRLYGIEPRYRRVRHPTHGAFIERYIGTYMGKVHMVRGTTFSNTKERGDYKSQKQAVMSLEELVLWTVQEVGIYHNTRHSALHRTPLEVWNDAWSSGGETEIPPYPADREKFFASLLPGTYRRVTREGLNRFSIKYWDDILLPLINDGKSYWVAHNPGNISAVYISIEGRFHKIPWRERSRRPIALFELDASKRSLKQAGDARPSEEAVFMHAEEKRAIEDAALESTRTQRRIRARRPIDDRVSVSADSTVDYTSAPSATLDPADALMR